MFDLGKFEFLYEAQNSFRLPEFKGSTLRGKFGHVLKRTICVMRGHECDTCPLVEKCAYTYLFETRNNRQEPVVRPFIIEPPLTRKCFFLKNDRIHFNLILLGKAVEYLPYFIYTFERMGEEGIGRDNGWCVVKTVWSVSDSGEKQEVYSHDSGELLKQKHHIHLDSFKSRLLPQVTVEFLTPTRLKRNGKFLSEEISFTELLRAVLRRYKSVDYFHGDGLKERYEIDWEKASRVKIVHSELRFQRLKRYSNRQGLPQSLSGLVGRISYEGEIGPFYPWLRIGELLHVGNGAVFGLGGYRVIN